MSSHLARGPGTALAALAALAACSVFAPKVRDSILFSHRQHVKDEQLQCEECHADIVNDTERKVQAIPGKQACADCHEVEDEESCGECHRRADSPSSWDRPGPAHLWFSHERHQQRKIVCGTCHRRISGNNDISPERRDLPGHDECETCHGDDLRTGRCALCHRQLHIYTRKPETLYSHRPGFFERHGRQAAAGGEQLCSTCHDQTFCADCHARTRTLAPAIRFPDRVDRSFVHRGDFRSRHALESRTGDTRCLKCHGRSFCAACHEKQGLGGRLGTRSPHPMPFVGHSRAARRRIAECAACHDQGAASSCARPGCHGNAGGRRGINPHPPGWKPPVSAGERSSHRMCGICH